MKGQSIRPLEDGGIELETEIDGTTRTIRFREDVDGNLDITLVQPDGTEVTYGEPVSRGKITSTKKQNIKDARNNGDVQTQIDHILDILDVIDLSN